ncbi:MAG TPA: xanthine dehydrogenase family protein molybdopterin-binding subunit [Acidimicrobiales bacterium]|nr:xanthine dehydrogenase family protein molybdopterin-binding subunit [Acidimicrobiales bacterium]
MEDPRLLTGRGCYVDDISLPGMLHAAFVRSTYAHALVRSVRLDRAVAMPGVVAVWSDREVRGMADDIVPTSMPGLFAPTFPVLARDKVRAVGEPVAVVLADSRAAAEDACEAVEVDYDPLTPVVDMFAAMEDSAPLVFDEAGTNVVYRAHHVVGDVAGEVARAATVVRERLSQHRHANVPMEGHGGVALYDRGTDQIDYFVSHQNPHAVRYQLARLLHHPAGRLRVRCGDIGGAFGQKGHLTREDAVVVAAARALGRPVKWVEDRYENLAFGGQAREEILDVEAAVGPDGIVTALTVEMVLDQGAYPLAGFAAAAITNLVRVLLPGAYRVAAVDFTATVVATNKATYVPYRGPWEAETWVRERLFDLVARRISADPVELRLRNLRPDDELPTRMCTGPDLIGITPRRILAEAAEAVGYSAFREEQARARTEGRYLGIGVANVLEPAPLPPSVMAAMGATAAPRTVQQARMRLEPDGSFTLFTSQQPHGQSHETTLAQLAADELGIGLDAVRVVHGDTEVTPFNLVGTGGSRSATLAGGAVLGVARSLREQLLQVAGRLLEVDPDDLELADGTVRPRGVPARAAGLAILAEAVYRAPARVSDDGVPGLEAVGSFASGEGTWSQATHCAVVEVDVHTGLVKVLRYVVVEDCGAIVNPAIVDGQVRGGVAQGIGSVLLERSVYGPDGQLLTGTLMDYLLPTATDVPPIEVHHLQGAPVGEVAFRGVGEGGAIGAPAAVTNAVEDALAPFGVCVTEQYLPPRRILELLGVISAEVGAIR